MKSIKKALALLLASLFVVLCLSGCRRNKVDDDLLEVGYTDYMNKITYYLVKDFAPTAYSGYDCAIPSPVIVAIDRTKKKDVKAYGAYFIDCYTVESGSMTAVSSGVHVGIIHMDCSTQGTVNVTEFEQATDMEDGIDDLVGRYDDGGDVSVADRLRTVADNTTNPYLEVRGIMLSAFVAANSLLVTSYTDADGKTNMVSGSPNLILSEVTYDATGEPFYPNGTEEHFTLEDDSGEPHKVLVTGYPDVIAVEADSPSGYLIYVLEE